MLYFGVKKISLWNTKLRRATYIN